MGYACHWAAQQARRLLSRTHAADKTNVAVICDAFLRYGVGQAIGLSEIGLNVTLYYIDRVDEFAGDANDRAQVLDAAHDAGVKLVSLPRRRMLSLPWHVAWLHRDLRRRRVAMAVVQSHIDPRYATLGVAYPVVLILHDPQTHSGDLPSIYPAPVRAIARISEVTAAAIILHSEQLLEQRRPLLRRLPVGIVPHGAHIAAAPLGVPPKRRLLLFGRLYAYKGVDTALEAFRHLPASLRDTELVVAGRGPLAAIARGERNVTVREEYISDNELDALLKEVRLVLLPYKDATQSGVGLLAVARGLPCVVSDAGGLPELVRDTELGLVFPAGDASRLAAAIAEHIDHDDTLRRAIYDHAATHFAWRMVAQRLRHELGNLGIELGSRGSTDRRAAPSEFPSMG